MKPQAPSQQQPRLRAVELYCGLGGFAAAVEEAVRVVAAVDISPLALGVYRHNYSHRVLAKNLDALSSDLLAGLEADLWWASPPCQPFTRRGHRLDLEDPRAETFKALVRHLEAVRPRYLAFENVVGFESSMARRLLLAALERAGYREVLEKRLCPSRLGVPNQRPRYYLVASRDGLLPLPTPGRDRRPVNEFLEPQAAGEARSLELDAALARRYRGALHSVAADDEEAVTHCFTSAYGRSPVRSGSYLETGQGLRHFSPREVLNLLGFPPSFRWPPGLRRSKAWKLAGNSLSLPPVRFVLSALPELEAPAGAGMSQRRPPA